MTDDAVDRAAVTTLIAAARAAIREHGDGDVHTVAAAVLDEHDGVHLGLNLPGTARSHLEAREARSSRCSPLEVEPLRDGRLAWWSHRPPLPLRG